MPMNSGEISDCDDLEDIVVKSVCERKNINRIIDSDSDEEISSKSTQVENEAISYPKDVFSSENVPANKSEEEDATDENLEAPTLDEVGDKLYINDDSYSEKNEKPYAKKGKGAPRKSKLNALEEIHSESQRMIRESRVSLPYHRPKQRSLADFLNRRKSLTVVPLKAAREKLTEVWQQIEQREKMAEKFFDSDSDESDTEVKEMGAEKKDKTESASNCETIKNNSTGRKVLNDCMSTDKVTENLTEDSKICNISLKDKDENNLFEDFKEKIFNDSSENMLVNFNHISSESVSYDATSIPFEEKNEAEDNTLNDDKFTKVWSRTDIFADSQDDTNDTSDSGEPCNKTNRINVLKHKLNLISEETLNAVPKISGSSDEVINLDENLPKAKGTVSLMKRFMKHVSLQPGKFSKKEEVSVIASEVNEKGEIINVTEETVSVFNEESKLPKLGQKLGLLKATLQQKMSRSREQQLAKRVQEYRLYEDELEPENGLENVDLEQEEEEELDLTETESESEPEEDDVVDEKKEKKVKNPFVEDEAEVSEDDVDDATEEELSDVENVIQSEKPFKPNEIPEELSNANISKTQDDDAINNILDLCSGNFTSQLINLTDLEGCETDDKTKISEDSEASDTEETCDNKNLEDNDSDEELIVSNRRKNKKKVYISDDEEESEEQNEYSSRNIDDSEVIKNKLSDDEQDDLQSITEDIASDHEENLVEDEEDELARKISKEFLDGEAELSGSDWDSADEDERELDDLEAELGDEEKISEIKLQKELGKIHFKEIMAEDKREVRLLQELLLEDGELHSDGPKRQRIFRWYNDDNENIGPDRYVEGEDGELHLLADEDDETWRRTRTEREKFLREKNIDNLEDLRNSLDTTSLNIGKSVRSAPKIQQNILKSPDPKQQFKLANKRGSFLNRSEKILNKLAQISTSTGLNENPIGSSKGKKNMVFAVVSPPKAEEKIDIPEDNKKALKRKSDFVITPPVKKIRFSSDTNVPSKRFSLLEQLKQSDMT